MRSVLPRGTEAVKKMEIDRKYHSSDRNSQVGKGRLPPLKIRIHSSLNYQVIVEWL